MAKVERIAVVCPSCRKPTKTGFAADIATTRRHLAHRDELKDYKTRCRNCGAWIFWSKAELVPESYVNERPQEPR